MIRTLPAYESRAKQVLGDKAPPNLFYRDEDPDDPEWVMNLRNMGAFESVTLRPRVLVDVSTRSISTDILGHKIAFPILPAPVGWLNRFHPGAELAVANAANAVGTAMALSTGSSTPLEEVAQATDGPKFFQLYVMKDRKLTEHLAQRAEAAGYAGLFVTVDDPPVRAYDGISVGAAPAGGAFGNFDPNKYPSVPLNREEFGRFKAANFQWNEIEWLRSTTNLPIVLKGIQTSEDAVLAREHGVNGLVVSNHGGHTTAGMDATLALLPGITDVAGDLEVYLDGGVRSGSDVLKALALGARAVLIGRPMLWGLAVDGEAGVKAVLEDMRDDLSNTLGLCGLTDVRDVNRTYVRLPRDF